MVTEATLFLYNYALLLGFGVFMMMKLLSIFMGRRRSNN